MAALLLKAQPSLLALGQCKRPYLAARKQGGCPSYRAPASISESTSQETSPLVAPPRSGLGRVIDGPHKVSVLLLGVIMPPITFISSALAAAEAPTAEDSISDAAGLLILVILWVPIYLNEWERRREEERKASERRREEERKASERRREEERKASERRSDSSKGASSALGRSYLEPSRRRSGQSSGTVSSTDGDEQWWRSLDSWDLFSRSEELECHSRYSSAHHQASKDPSTSQSSACEDSSHHSHHSSGWGSSGGFGSSGSSSRGHSSTDHSSCSDYGSHHSSGWGSSDYGSSGYSSGSSFGDSSSSGYSGDD